ncbi:hypothetical protein L6452_00531 [Arctium lappa]|uniref:Uncharacterized protein n=1 Tax=Arctium lappa TaxID=4217 RepID=A0ACB9FEA1_ARCLA|nr:hypothetical protein L6452_00531 [Arctium lappa]
MKRISLPHTQKHTKPTHSLPFILTSFPPQPHGYTLHSSLHIHTHTHTLTSVLTIPNPHTKNGETDEFSTGKDSIFPCEF